MKTYIASVLLAGCLCSSCSDFLTMTPEHSLTMDNSVTSYSGAQNAVNGIYGVYEGCSSLGGYLYSSLHCMAGMSILQYQAFGHSFINVSMLLMQQLRVSPNWMIPNFLR